MPWLASFSYSVNKAFLLLVCITSFVHISNVHNWCCILSIWNEEIVSITLLMPNGIMCLLSLLGVNIKYKYHHLTHLKNLLISFKLNSDYWITPLFCSSSSEHRKQLLIFYMRSNDHFLSFITQKIRSRSFYCTSLQNKVLLLHLTYRINGAIK